MDCNKLNKVQFRYDFMSRVVTGECLDVFMRAWGYSRATDFLTSSQNERALNPEWTNSVRDVRDGINYVLGLLGSATLIDFPMGDGFFKDITINLSHGMTCSEQNLRDYLDALGRAESGEVFSGDHEAPTFFRDLANLVYHEGTIRNWEELDDDD